jgi:hypothetical protein
MVQCRKTGRWYNPHQEFERLMLQSWFVAIMQRLKNR